MNKEIILFDWDDTLSSKTEYKKNLRGNLARICEAPEEEIFKIEEKYFNGLIKSDYFTIDGFVKVFSQKFGKKINLEDFSSDKLGIYSRALFPETVTVLKKLKNYFRLGIYSQGYDNLQIIKIKSSGIKSFFDEQLIFISRNKLDPKFLETLPNGATIIEDKPEVVQKLKATKRFNPFWINRKDEQTIDGVTTVKNLDEFYNLMIMKIKEI